MRLSYDTARPRRRVLTALVLIFLAIALAFVTPVRQTVLRGLGDMLVAHDDVREAEAIVISQDANGAGVLAAADLVAAGVAGRVAVFSDPPTSVDREFLKRGVPYYNAAEVSRKQLQSLGVSNVEVIERTALGTQDAANKLVDWCQRQGLRKVVFVVYADHSRRARRLLDRAAAGKDVQIFVQPSAYSGFDPHSWWRSHASVRTQLIESQKLLFDFLRHPF
jgi:uncharacterized SAM-binding protein YcdF (DUF218 family)